MPRPFGYKVKEETKRKISLTRKRLGLKPVPYKRNPNVKKECHICSKEFEVIFSRKEKAKFCSNECRSKSMLGMVPHNKGIHTSTKYGGYHYKVKMIRGTPKKCEDCGTTKAKKFEWANLTGHYENEWDYKRLCTSCHCKLDNKIRNIINSRK